MAYPNITPLPTPPNPDSPATFDTLAYPFTQAQVTLVAEINALIAQLNATFFPDMPLRATIDGTAASPAYSWQSDPDTGIYRVGANQIGISAGGVQRLLLSSTAFTSAVPVVVPAGSASAPAVTTTGDPDTGMLFPAANVIAWATAGSEKLRLTSAGLLTSATAITQSINDTTSGRIIKTGDAGLMLSDNTPQTYTDLNDATISGVWGYTTTALNRPTSPGAVFTNTVEVIRDAAGGRIYQISRQAGGTDANAFEYHRSYNGTTWSPWYLVYSSRNAVGSVSQSSGVPTGAIIERGSNANGEYVRYADGTLICTNRVAESSHAVTSADGVLFQSVSAISVTFPSPFAQGPAISVNVTNPSGVVGLFSRDVTASTTGASCRFAAGASTTVATLRFSYIAIGRWF